MGSEYKLFDVDSALITVAHELKSPLSLMRQLALYLDDNLKTGELQQIARQINLTSERGLRLVNDLTKIARLEDAMFELEPINPYKICDEVLYELRTTAKFKRKRLGYAGNVKPKLVIANPELLSGVIYNFCDNALHYSGKEGESKLMVKSRGDKIRIAVRDYGPALPLNTWRMARGRVTASPQTINSRPGSSGLGLFIADRFARAMNARLGAIRHRDGTTFYIDLLVSNQMSLL